MNNFLTQIQHHSILTAELLLEPSGGHPKPNAALSLITTFANTFYVNRITWKSKL